MASLGVLLGVLALIVSVGFLWWIRAELERLETALRQITVDAGAGERIDRIQDVVKKQVFDLAQAHDELVEDFEAHRELVREEVKKQNLAIAEGIEHVDRAERRVRTSVRRAQKRLEEHGFVDPTVEAEADGLRELDGDRGPTGGVQPVREGVAQPAGFDFSDLPGEWP